MNIPTSVSTLGFRHSFRFYQKWLLCFAPIFRFVWVLVNRALSHSLGYLLLSLCSNSSSGSFAVVQLPVHCPNWRPVDSNQYFSSMIHIGVVHFLILAQRLWISWTILSKVYTFGWFCSQISSTVARECYTLSQCGCPRILVFNFAS